LKNAKDIFEDYIIVMDSSNGFGDFFQEQIFKILLCKTEISGSQPFIVGGPLYIKKNNFAIHPSVKLDQNYI